jgi:threonylcarbamoyladenosine tRNA methylthiotransferase MtaB
MLRPGIAVGADLIAGFPTETEALFQETLAFVDEAAIPYLHVFAYSERPGTPAARMPGVPEPERRERAARLRAAALPHAAAFHAGLIGRTVQVIAERGGGGHTEHFVPVQLATSHAPGSLLQARVTAADAAGLQAHGL